MNIGKEFIEKTKYKYLSESAQTKGIAPPPLQLDYDKNAQIIKLPNPEDIEVKDISLRYAIENRQSIRNYSEESLTLEELSYLLWVTQGVKKKSDVWTLRTVPSAGARHAFETYLYIDRVKNLESGLYRFLALEHKLLKIETNENIKEEIVEGCWGQKIVSLCAVTFIWIAVPDRMNWRYQVRGYRYLHLDAGHVCQNLYLAAENVSCGICAIAAFQDEKMDKILNLKDDQFTIYIATVGKK